MSAMYRIIIQHATDKKLAPKSSRLREWARKTLGPHLDTAEVTIRIVDVQEITHLNTTYRLKKGPTNILSFPFIVPEHIPFDMPVLGDIVICAEIVNKEAEEQKKSQEAHWAHLVVHGILHLLGYDHELSTDAEIMEALEIKMLKLLHFDNPYDSGEDIKTYE